MTSSLLNGNGSYQPPGPGEEHDIPAGLIQVRDIEDGAEYVYSVTHPRECVGHRYRVHKREARMVPSYQAVVLVEGLSGPDQGIWWVCSPAYFCVHFRRVESP